MILVLVYWKNESDQAYILSEADVSSTSLMSGGRCAPPSGSGGVRIADEGGPYPSEPFTGVFESAGNMPAALRDASNELDPPGEEKAGAFDGDVGGNCTWEGGGVDGA